MASRSKLLPLLLLTACSGSEGIIRTALEEQGLSDIELQPASEQDGYHVTARKGDEDCSGLASVQGSGGAAQVRSELACLPPAGSFTMALPAGADPATVALARRCDGEQHAACTELGVAYLEGAGIPEDQARALALFEHACQRADGQGCHQLGLQLAGADGAQRDLARAGQLHVMGCDLGCAQACGEAARILYNGELGAPDYEQVKEVAQRGCDADDATSCLVLGVLYANAQGVGSDLDLARRLLMQACNGGQKPACIILEELP